MTATTLPGMAGWRGFYSPAFDAAMFLIQNAWTVKKNAGHFGYGVEFHGNVTLAVPNRMM